jgi:hypothetical protein
MELNMKILLTALFLTLLGCSDAKVAQFESLGQPAMITCYSGGEVIYQGFSTGKVSTEQNSDGWFWVEKETGDLIRASGQCIVRQHI